MFTSYMNDAVLFSGERLEIFIGLSILVIIVTLAIRRLILGDTTKENTNPRIRYEYEFSFRCFMVGVIVVLAAMSVFSIITKIFG